jgi:cell division septal protein FtsQ
VERLKPMQRNAASGAAEHEAYRPELISDEEPKFLRRQKPVEIRRRKLGGKTWSFYRRVIFWSITGLAILTVATIGTRFALHSPEMLLLQLDTRRSEIQEVSWVEDASVQRILPNRLRVEITERTPIAFFRNGAELTLIDSHGVLLDRPEGEDFHFPIVTGLSENIPRDEREKRMKIYQEFMQAIELVKSGSADRVSELDLANPRDVRVVLTGLAGADKPQAVTVHFGQSDFNNKYRMLIENFAQWQANSGRVQTIDLQYSRQVVINADSSTATGKQK